MQLELFWMPEGLPFWVYHFDTHETVMLKVIYWKDTRHEPTRVEYEAN